MLILPVNINVVELMFWLLLLNFILEKEKSKILWENKVFILLQVQYPILVSFRIFLTPEHDFEIITRPAEYQMWMYCVLGVFVSTVFFGKVRALHNATVFLAGSLFITFFVAAYHFYVLGNPKVTLFNGNVFQAPIFATMIGIILFSIIKKDNLWIIAKTISIFAPLLILSIAYAGTRGIFLGQIATLTLGILVFSFLREYCVAMGLLASLVLGVAIGFSIDALTGGSFVGRLEVIFLLAYNNMVSLAVVTLTFGFLIFVSNYARQRIDFRNWQHIAALIISVCVASAWIFEEVALSGATDQVSSIHSTLSDNIDLASASNIQTAIRLQLLQKGLLELEGHLLTGRGVYLEPYITREVVSEQMHLHNNYMSWLIWGGIFILASGLIWLCSLTMLIGKQRGLYIMIFPLMIVAFWLIILIFDSFFAWSGFTYAYVILTCLAYQIFRLKIVKRTADQKDLMKHNQK